MLHLRRRHREAVGADDFLALGLVALSYALAELAGGYGFLAVFAAGVALRRVEFRASGGASRDELLGRRAAVAAGELATDPRTAPHQMTRSVLRFNEHVERVGEVAVMIVLGSLLSASALSPAGWWFVPLLFVGLRPLAVWAGLAGAGLGWRQRALVGWFGVRGAGSVYYLAYALTHGLDGPAADALTRLTLTVVAASVVVHGVSVTPLMAAHDRRRAERAARADDRGGEAGGRRPPGEGPTW